MINYKFNFAGPGRALVWFTTSWIERGQRKGGQGLNSSLRPSILLKTASERQGERERERGRLVGGWRRLREDLCTQPWADLRVTRTKRPITYNFEDTVQLLASLSLSLSGAEAACTHTTHTHYIEAASWVGSNRRGCNTHTHAHTDSASHFPPLYPPSIERRTSCRHSLQTRSTYLSRWCVCLCGQGGGGCGCVCVCLSVCWAQKGNC